MNKYLDIDTLKSYNVDPAYFGLGFIQLKISDNKRIHFYHNSLPVISEEPHNHRYNFTSTILQGTLYQKVYQSINNNTGDYVATFTNCKPENTKNNKTNVLVDLKEVFSTVHSVNTSYDITSEVLHTVKAKDNCITYLKRNTPIKELACSVHKVGIEPVCPFSQKISVRACWELIEDMLPKKHITGYHINPIEKGILGEPSKILEEVLELIDAHEQNVKIMTAIELSDLYGAMEAYRTKYLPGFTSKDITDMHKVTKRAFDNGQR